MLFVGKSYKQFRDTCVCETAGNWCPASLHEWVNVSAVPMGTYSPLVDLLGHPSLAQNAIGKYCFVFLANILVYLMDGLYGGPDEQPYSPPVLFESYPFDSHWSCSVFTSMDPVALDSVAFDFLRNEPNIPFASSGCVDNCEFSKWVSLNSV